MAKKHCTFIPSKGQDLFLKLKKEFGYENAKAIFLRAINPKFISDYKSSLTLDGEGIPTLESILSNSYMKKFIGDTKIINLLEKKYPLVSNTINGYNESLEKAYAFNTKSPYNNNYIATVELIEDKIKIKINPKNESLVNKFKDQYSASLLNNKLTEIFKPLGITLGSLSQKEIKAGRVGVTDFSKARETAEGFDSIIRVANNMEGATAISEEFAHLLIGIFKNDSLVDRSIKSLSKDKEALKEVLGNEYEDTINFHDGNLELVAEEALGKILQKNLLNEVSIPKTSSTSLFKRMINYIKSKFKGFNVNDINQAIFDADSAMNTLSKSILEGTRQITKEDVTKAERDAEFNALSDRIERNINILKEASKVEVKRYKISKEANKQKQEELVGNILDYTEENANTVEGIFEYARQALKNLTSLYNQFDSINTMTTEQKFKFLRLVRQYNESYGIFLNSMHNAITEESQEEDNMFLRNFYVGEEEINTEEVIEKLTYISKKLASRFNSVAMNSFTEFIKPFFGEEIVVPFGKYAGSTLSVEQLLNEAEQDISFLDLWLDSMAESSDIILQLFDSAVKSAKDKARLDTIKLIKESTAIRLKAESLGINNFDWLFEKDDAGNLSGNYISEINYAQFDKDKKEFEEYLENKYGKNPSGIEAQQKIAERQKWLSENAFSPFGAPIPNPTKYKNKEFSKLSKNQLEIYNDIIAFKQKIEEKLPKEKTATLKAIQIRKDKTERFLQSMGSPSSIYENIKESIADTFLDRADDDTMFGEKTAGGITDFTGREFMTLPILYTTRLENPNELSTDIFGSLSAYAYMACNYEQMDKIIDPLEIGRVIINENRKVRKNKGDNPLIEKIEALDVQVINKVFSVEGTNIIQKLDNFFESQVYMRYLKDEGSFEILGKDVNKAKITNWVLGLSSTVQLGFNWLANIANVGTGVAMQNIEAAAGEFFNPRELASADKTYVAEMADFVKELGSRNKTSKLHLFDELFNIKQDYNKKIKSDKRKNWLYRLFGENVAFIGQEGGDHWLYNRTAIAMAKRQKVKVPNKGEMSLWDALQVRSMPENENIKEIYLPEGTTDENNNTFDIKSFGRKIAHVNQHLFGIYNQEDANAANRISMGRLLMQYRKWMKPQYNKRFQAARYNVTTGEFEEGYYRTLGRFVNELIRGQFQLSAQWDNMEDHEKANVRRALTEMVQTLAVWAVANWVEWPDDKNRPWSVKMAEYMAQRMTHELGGLTPSTIMPQELIKTLKTPIASLSVVQSLLNVANSAITPSDWTNELQSGPYEGMSTLEKNLLKAPIPVLTHYRQIDRFLDDIDTSIQFYVRNY